MNEIGRRTIVTYDSVNTLLVSQLADSIQALHRITDPTPTSHPIVVHPDLDDPILPTLASSQLFDSSLPPSYTSGPSAIEDPPQKMGSQQADPTQAVDGLVRAMRDLTTDPNYKLVADVFSEFLFLKDRNDRLTTSHREVLDQYHKYRKDLDETKLKLEKEKRELEGIIQEKVQEIIQLSAVRTRLEADLHDTTNNLNQEKENAAAAAEKAAREFADLQTSKETELAELQTSKETELAALQTSKETELAELQTSKETELAELQASKESELAALQALKESELADLQALMDSKLAELQTLKETELAELQALKESELAELQAKKDGELADLQAAKEAVEQAKKEGEEAAAAAAEVAAGEIADLNSAKTALEEWKAQAELDAEKAAQDIAGLESDKANLEEIKATNEAEIASLQATIATLEAEKKSVEDALEAANAEIASLHETIATKNSEIESLQESMRAAEEQIASLQQTVEDKNAEIETLHTKLTDETARADAAIAHGESLQSQLDETCATLSLTSRKLADLEQYRIPLNDSSDEVYVNVLDKIWTTIVTLVEETFRPDLDADVLADQSCWKNLRDSPYLKHATQLAIPLPQSNSPAAKGMRISAILAILSRALAKHVFRPVYLFDDEDDENLVKFLRILEDEDPTREGHMRSTLLSMMPERQMQLGARRVKTVVREVSWLVQHLLGAIQFENFLRGLEDACKLSCEQWMRIQMAQIKVEPYFGPPYDDFDWQVLELPEFDPLLDDGEHHGHGGGFSHSVVGDDDDATTIREKQQHDMDGGASVTGAPTAPPSHHNDPDGPLETVEAGMVPLPDSRATSSMSHVERSSIGTGTYHDSMMGDEGMEGGLDTEIDPDEILLVVWPSMCSVENGDLMSITQGLVISKEQARPALEEVRSRSRLAARPGSRRARTMSMPGQSRASSPTRAGKREMLLAAREAARGDGGNSSAVSPDLGLNGSAVDDDAPALV